MHVTGTSCSKRIINFVLSFSTTLCAHSFIRLCDYLVVTMLHNLTVKSVTHILTVLHDQLSKPVEIHDLVQPIPEDVEEQEKILAKIYETVGYTPTHLDRGTARQSTVHLTGSGLFQRAASMSRAASRLQMTPSVSWWIVLPSHANVECFNYTVVVLAAFTGIA